MVTVFAQPIKHFENPPDYRDQTHVLHLRDSVTIEIKNSFANSSVSETQNDANIKFEVVNNANNANIAMGDNSNQYVASSESRFPLSDALQDISTLQMRLEKIALRKHCLAPEFVLFRQY